MAESIEAKSQDASRYRWSVFLSLKARYAIKLHLVVTTGSPVTFLSSLSQDNIGNNP
jgi:hypothetical protein